MSATIIAKNQTVSGVVLADLGVMVPGSGQVTLTESLRSDEILGSPDLQTEVLAGNIVLFGTEDIPIADSTSWFTGNYQELPGVGAAEGGTVYSADSASTTSRKFVDAFGGASVTVPKDGSYFCLYEGVFGGKDEGRCAIGVGVNSITTAEPATERVVRVFDVDDLCSAVSSGFLASLTAGDTVHGLYRTDTGHAVSAGARRLTIIKVNV